MVKKDELLYDVLMGLYQRNDTFELHRYVETLSAQLEKNGLTLAWKPVGGDEGFFSTFKSQQDEPVRALVELPANSIDSMIIKNCWVKDQLDPKSKEAPQSVEAAIEKYYDGVKPSEWYKEDGKRKREVAEDIQIIAQGRSKRTPSIVVYDFGEGQNPDDFEDTFLSIQKSNKIRINCVQGKFNMGSTGVFEFLDGRRYKLIVSRRNEAIPGAKKEVGFVLVRKHELTESEISEGVKSSWYEYMVIDGKIPRVKARNLDLGLYNREFTTGTAVKLYSYKLDLASDITLDLWKDLNQNLYEPALPFLVFEDRKNKQKNRMYKGNTPTKVLLGNKARILKDDQKYREKTIPVSAFKNGMGNVTIDVHVLKQSTPINEFVREKAVIFTLNGQMHASLKRNFISQELGFPNLRDTTLINVDCTNLHLSFIDELFMGSRDRFKRGDEYKQLMNIVTKNLKNNQLLIDLENKRRAELKQNAKTTDGLLKKMLSKAPITKAITNYLNFNNKLKVINKINVENFKRKLEEKELKEFPTYFKLVGNAEKEVAVNGKVTFKFETDANDDYRINKKVPIYMEIFNIAPKVERDIDTETIEELFDYTVEGPNDGIIKITFEPKTDKWNINDEAEISIHLIGESENFENIVKMTFVQAKKREKNEKENTTFPAPIKVYKDRPGEANWSDYADYNEKTVAKILTVSTTKGLTIDAIAVNMDSNILENYFHEKNITSMEEAEYLKEKYFTVIYLNAIALYASLEKEIGKEAAELEKQIDEISSNVLENMGNLLLYTHNEMN
jgi:hypothetical protein